MYIEFWWEDALKISTSIMYKQIVW